MMGHLHDRSCINNDYSRQYPDCTCMRCHGNQLNIIHFTPHEWKQTRNTQGHNVHIGVENNSIPLLSRRIWTRINRVPNIY